MDDKYILKIGKSDEDNETIKKDIYFCELFKNKLPSPQIIHTDTSRKIADKNYFIYHKIKGENLYARWHSYTDKQRKSIIKQICEIIKIIHETPYEEFAEKFNIKIHKTWKEKVCYKIDVQLKQLNKQRKLSAEKIKDIRNFVEKTKTSWTKRKLDSFTGICTSIISLLIRGR